LPTRTYQNSFVSVYTWYSTRSEWESTIGSTLRGPISTHSLRPVSLWRTPQWVFHEFQPWPGICNVGHSVRHRFSVDASRKNGTPFALLLFIRSPVSKERTVLAYRVSSCGVQLEVIPARVRSIRQTCSGSPPPSPTPNAFPILNNFTGSDSHWESGAQLTPQMFHLFGIASLFAPGVTIVPKRHRLRTRSLTNKYPGVNLLYALPCVVQNRASFSGCFLRQQRSRFRA